MAKVAEVMNLIDSAKGKFFAVTFVERKTGEVRHMICRTGVRKYVKGVGLKFNPRERGLVGVWSADAQGYRFIPCEMVMQLVIAGQTYNFEMPNRISTTQALQLSSEIAGAAKETQ